mmetsp:Transcript_12623/g.29866  ORF Transcript_12623/g.29866 Transcript_12623/m.29866 type:complete len:308 (+) Transcript_12623:43-966(+)
MFESYLYSITNALKACHPLISVNVFDSARVQDCLWPRPNSSRNCFAMHPVVGFASCAFGGRRPSFFGATRFVNSASVAPGYDVCLENDVRRPHTAPARRRWCAPANPRSLPTAGNAAGRPGRPRPGSDSSTTGRSDPRGPAVPGPARVPTVPAEGDRDRFPCPGRARTTAGFPERSPGPGRTPGSSPSDGVAGFRRPLDRESFPVSRRSNAGVPPTECATPHRGHRTAARPGPTTTVVGRPRPDGCKRPRLRPQRAGLAAALPMQGPHWSRRDFLLRAEDLTGRPRLRRRCGGRPPGEYRNPRPRPK